MTTNEIRKYLENLVDESIGKTLKETNAIKHIGIDEEKSLVILIINIGKAGGEPEAKLRREIAKIVKLQLGFKGVKIQFQEQRKIDSIINRKVKFIVITSGKGGVGKSTISANIAYALTRKGQKVGLIDADIYGSSIPKILDVPHSYPRGTADGKIIPFKKGNIEFISTEFFTELGKPVIWRGAMLNSMIQHFFYDVMWSKDLDFMIIDAPPGTGDIMLDIKNHVPDAECIIVTTPHLAASHVAIKAGLAAKQLKHEIIGVIENMSYYINPVTNKPEYIFGSGGGEEVSEKLGTELIVKIPIAQPEFSLALYESEEEIGQIFDFIATLLITRYL
ncbi:MAG TPA: P-loop NTPase [Bacilli bacterium]|nr:P-loop NTPase [Bacilli bacterium]HPT89718.1 P-loop NTPase [Bacilli bacterium]HQA19443.1 P-loop NTPase [Bacilli bacterium]HQD92146.1 P-loop NTPase [Bacilli bacterium]